MDADLHSGKLVKWKDDRGFGFIQPDDGGKEVFLHISELKDSVRRPRLNDTIHYYCVINSDGKTRAVNASIQGVRKRSQLPLEKPKFSGRRSSKKSITFLLAKLLVLLCLPLTGAAHFGWVTGNIWPLMLYPVMSVFTYVLYADDKTRAKQKVWRTSEQTLHVCELVGGWPGGYVAQQVLRHKSLKQSYQVEFWLIVAIHQIAWLVWLGFGPALIP
ncbi:DUF1294 domain-containing protein [filamentous cyanobacterium CCT1]|nr:DUF1294 domain-containing protein [filamentous cyanobacterium CCT1]PSN81080.1 DUF1294 domain-containing protein [filamentous cyanobacterium CCP4]